MISTERNFFAYLDEMKIITILLPLSYHHGKSSSFSISNEFDNYPLKILNECQIENNHKYICQLSEEISFGKSYWIIDEHGGKTDLQIGAVIRTDVFDEKFYYDKDDLGIKFSPDHTVFKIWAPTATQLKLKLR